MATISADDPEPRPPGTERTMYKPAWPPEIPKRPSWWQKRQQFNAAMPLAASLHDDGHAVDLYNELRRLMRIHNGVTDFVWHNVGTGIALATSGAAAILAQRHSFVASVLAAASAFIVALTRTLSFVQRWAWHAATREKCVGLIYELNRAGAVPEPKRSEDIFRVTDALIAIPASRSLMPVAAEQDQR